MLNNAQVIPTLPATDLDRARKFYTEKLGLKETKDQIPGGIGFDCGQGTMLYIYQRPPVKVEHTVASFTVEDLEQEMKELRARGVVFEEYDQPMPGLKTVNGIADIGDWRAAWFKDSEGNILALGETKTRN